MAQVKLKPWTKERLDEIKEEEGHTSLDSVVKSLLKERENNER